MMINDVVAALEVAVREHARLTVAQELIECNISCPRCGSSAVLLELAQAIVNKEMKNGNN